jgi:hypothetical protein
MICLNRSAGVRSSMRLQQSFDIDFDPARTLSSSHLHGLSSRTRLAHNSYLILWNSKFTPNIGLKSNAPTSSVPIGARII